MKSRWLVPLLVLACAAMAAGQEGAREQEKKEVLHGSHHVEPRFDPLVVPDFSTAFDDGPFVVPILSDRLAQRSLFKIKTEKNDAQKWFRFGMALYHHQKFDVSQAAFRKVSVLDGDSAMAYWGMGIACENLPGRAAMFVRRAAEMAEDDGVPFERDLIRCYAKFYKDPKADLAPRQKRLLADLESLALKYPQRLEILPLVVRIIARPDFESPLVVDALIERVLKACPGHVVDSYRCELWERRDEKRARAALDRMPEEELIPSFGSALRKLRFNERVGRYDLAGMFGLQVVAEWLTKQNQYRGDGWENLIPKFDPVIASPSSPKGLDDEISKVLALYEKGEKAAAFRLFDHNFRCSCALADRAAITKLDPIAKEMKLPGEWVIRDTKTIDAPLISFDLVGLSTWRASSWQLPDESGKQISSRSYQGKLHVMVFFLGSACEHCMGQLEGFALNAAAFEKAGVPIVAVSIDGEEKLPKTRRKKSGEKFPFPVVADPELKVFKAYDAFDEFAERPLHATVIVNAAGRVAWRHIGGQPFHNIEAVLELAKGGGSLAP